MTRRGFLSLIAVLPMAARSGSADGEVIRIVERITATDKRESRHLEAIVRAYRNLAPSPARSGSIVSELTGAIRCADQHSALLTEWKALEVQQMNR